MHRTVRRWSHPLLVLVGVAALSVGAGAATLEVVPAASEAWYRDEARRDDYLRERMLTTARFPNAELVPREIRGLPVPLPGSGQAPVQILGALTIRGVTRPTTWEGTAEFSVMWVLSIEDHIRLEVDLTLRPAS